ncbi:uncharacterized protein LOC129775881 [Toxorhynchites rutilus septentrionalis]|uniref:uncharacterized protein LOC129775881 n=1 Tax=Toxorhynchites rutilus septentrionalis TaxID=329112 RepID=UPI002479C59D|nr:uncharacterized protein LOC129775881 [Toxorhynchites rutilus septentrionalis]
MFKILKSVVHLGSKPVNRCSAHPPALPVFYSTFVPQEFQFESSDGESGTLIHRFSRHIALTKRDFSDPTKYNFKYSSFYPVYNPDEFLRQLADISSHDIGKLISFTSDFRGKSDPRLFTDVVNALDEECESRVEQASFKELVGMLHGFMYLIPNKISKLKTYRKAMPRLVTLFQSNSNEKDFTTVLFFLGLWKQNAEGSKLLDQFLQTHLDQFLDEKMELMDFVLLANASYKTSVRIRSELFFDRLIGSICSFEESDSALFVTLIKCARMNRIWSEEIMEKIRDMVQNHGKGFDFRGLSHLFAYIADNLVKDDALNRLFLAECSKHIEREIKKETTGSIPQHFRAKDLSTFLWSCSTLSIPLEDLDFDLNVLMDEIFRKIDNNEYRFNPDILVDTCLSLWIMNHISVDLLASIFGNRQFTAYFRKDRVKVASRRDLLLACAEIERPEAFKLISRLERPNAFQLSRQAPDYLVKNRFELQRVKSGVENIKERLQINNVAYNAPIKYLNIAGLLLKAHDGKMINIDVLHEGFHLSDGQTPTGLMGLKTRLLNKMNVETIMLIPKQMQSDEQLVQAVEEAILSVTQSGITKQTPGEMVRSN